MQSSGQIITNKLAPSFLQAGRPSCHSAISVTALKGYSRGGTTWC